MAAGSSASGRSSSWRAPRRTRADEPGPPRRPHHVLRAGDLHRLRGDLEGADHPAHAPDVRLQRDPRHHPRRRAADRGRRPHPAAGRPRLRRGRARHHERGGRVRRDRPDAGDVQGKTRMTIATALVYLLAAVLFIVGLKFLSSPRGARRGNTVAAGGMVLAVAWTVVLLRDRFTTAGIVICVLGVAIGAVAGTVGARRVHMTAMPQMVALFNGVGGGAAALIALAELHKVLPPPGAPKADISIGIALSALIGAISFSGSMVAFAKLQELIGGRPITYAGQQFVN